MKNWKEKIPNELITGSKTRIKGGLRFCPLCLKNDEKPYYRKYWRLKLVTCCPTHNVILHDRCPNSNCNKSIRFISLDYKKPTKLCLFCGTDLSAAPSIKISSNDAYIKTQNQLLIILKQGKWKLKNEETFSSFQFFEALYQMARFIVRCLPFDSTTYGNHPFLSFRLLESKRNHLKLRDNLFENLPASHLVLQLAYSYLKDYPQGVNKIISKYQTTFNDLTQKNSCAEILERFRLKKETEPLTKTRILNAIGRLSEKDIELTYENVAKEASCTPSFNLSHPHLKNVVDFFKDKISEPFYEKAKDIVNEIKQRGKKVTITYIAHRLDCTTDKVYRDPVLKKLIFEDLKPLIRRLNIPEDEILRIIRELKSKNMPITFKNLSKKLNLSDGTLRRNKNYREIILPHLTSHVFKMNPESIKKSITNKKNDTLLISKENIKNCLEKISQNNEKITLARVASKLCVSTPVINENPEYRAIIMEAGNIKPLQKITITPESVKNAINELKQRNEKITYRSVASLLGCNWWNIQQKLNIKEIVDNHHSNKNKPKYNISDEQVKKVIENIKKKGLKITQNEVCRRLSCTRSYFRNKPKLKAIIMKAKRKEDEKIQVLIQPFEDYENLSSEAQKFEKIYLNYIKEMEKFGKNWRIAQNKRLSRTLNIPLDILLEIKNKYIPFTRKKMKAKIRNEFQERLISTG